jgi:hypothetical protein
MPTRLRRYKRGGVRICRRAENTGIVIIVDTKPEMAIKIGEYQATCFSKNKLIRNATPITLPRIEANTEII